MQIKMMKCEHGYDDRVNDNANGNNNNNNSKSSKSKLAAVKRKKKKSPDYNCRFKKIKI